MSGTIGRNLLLSSPLKVEEEANKFTEKHGIVSILGSSAGEQTKSTSLRRTLSADMSSRKWLAQQGFSPSLSSSTSCSEGEEEEEGHEHRDKEGKAEVEKPGEFDIWGSILSQKTIEEEEPKLPPLYVHPLVKRSTSSLSAKSLEICTENLGSETGSDIGFSSSVPSETADAEYGKYPQPPLQPRQQQQAAEKWCSFGAIIHCITDQKLQPRCFPPPLPSRGCGNGPSRSLHVHPHRKNGRLVLEAVSVPSSQNNFRAQRQEGRLLLTFVDTSPNQKQMVGENIDQEEDRVEEIEEMLEIFEEEMEKEAAEDETTDVEEEEAEEEEEEEEEEEGLEEKLEIVNGGKQNECMAEQAHKLSSGVITVHRSALMMKKLPSWENKLNKAVKLVAAEDAETTEEEEDVGGADPLAQSVPRRARVARLIRSPPQATVAAATFNAYEYFWRTKSSVGRCMINPITQKGQLPFKNKCNYGSVGPINNNSPPKREMVLLRGNKGDYLVPLFRRCKENRRSLLIWEPNWIASS